MLRPNYDDPAVREGALLRIASDLLVPFGELGNFDRQELLEWLEQLGIEPAAGADRLGPFWIDGVCPGPEPKDEVTFLRSDGDWWVVGYWERGSFRIDHRFGRRSRRMPMDAPPPGVPPGDLDGHDQGSTARS